jgi:hemoglobin-like flavoprotein
MNSTEVALVKDSFRKVVPIADQAAALFYARLFELDSSLRPLFRGDMAEQGRKLMTMLAAAVTSLDHVDRLLPVLRQLGARHVTYGVRDEHYDTVGTALLWTLEKGLGPDFNPEVRGAWTKTYTFIADTMIEAAREARSPVDQTIAGEVAA